MPVQFDNSDQLCQHVAQSSEGLCLLAFSTDKDSIAAWLQLRRHFTRIVPFYLYLIPDLEFVETSLRYYEEVFETRIIRLPHPSLYRWLNGLVFQAPQNAAVIERVGLPNFDYQDSQRVICEDYHLPLTTLAASGVRAVDSLNRWAAIKKYGPVNHKKKTFYPIFDWNKDRLIREMEESGIKLPADYHLFGRSFDGLDYRFLKPIRDTFPADYDRILQFFPLADLELHKMEYRSAHSA